MVSLSLMVRLVEAVRPDARLVLVGDPGQLASVEAGAVLGDVVGPAADGLRMRAAARGAARGGVGHDGRGGCRRHRDRRRHRRARPRPPLRRGDRRRGRRDPRRRRRRALAALWRPARDGVDVAAARGRDGGRAARGAVAAARAVIAAARAGDALAALARAQRLPAAVRAPPRAVRRRDVERADRGVARRGRRRASRRAPGTRGARCWSRRTTTALRLFNGDTGVIVRRGDGRVAAAFERRGEVLEFAPPGSARSRPSTR